MVHKDPARTCSQTSCHAQYCSHGCHAQPQILQAPQQDQQRINGCGNECQWGYNEQCCNSGVHHHHGGNVPEIQCRDISQSQQGSPIKPPEGMRQDSYRRTLEYVQQCRNWSGNGRQGPDGSVSSSTHPIPLPQALPASANMIVNDMTSSLSSLLEENRYLQMIQ